MSDKGQGDKTRKLFSLDDSTVFSKSSIPKKKLRDEKLALELKIAERQCEDELRVIRAEVLQRKKLLEIRKRAQESKLEYEYENVMAQR